MDIVFQVLKTSMPTSTRCLTSQRFDDPQGVGFVAYKPDNRSNGSCCTSFDADYLHKDKFWERKRINGVGYLILTSFEMTAFIKDLQLAHW